MKTGAVFTIITSLLFVAGCSTPGVHEADRGIEGTLRSEVNEKHVDIDVHHGVVKLEGHVRTTADRDRIEALARSTPGVVAVKDELKVTFPTPGTYGAYPSIPVYQGALPEVAPGGVAVVAPPVEVVPDYPAVKVQPTTDTDLPQAGRIVEQLRAAGLPQAGLQDVTITVRSGDVSLQGRVGSQRDHDALLAAIERAEGVRAIYDKLRVG